jgi:hypothetical protein
VGVLIFGWLVVIDISIDKKYLLIGKIAIGSKVMLKQFIAGICLTIGLVFLLVPISVSMKPDATAKDRDAALGGLILGLPTTAWGSWLVADTRRRQQQMETTFVRLLKASEGTVTILELAETANVSVVEARFYLDDKAVELECDFEITDRGGIIYHFPIV